jgi:hypothetical protein
MILFHFLIPSVPAVSSPGLSRRAARSISVSSHDQHDDDGKGGQDEKKYGRKDKHICESLIDDRSDEPSDLDWKINI